MRTSGDFSLNDLPGAGRMDVACRCVTSSLLLSHGIRNNISLYIHMLGEPDPPKTLLFKGDHMKYLSPDERSTASLIKKALSLKVSRSWITSTPGVFVSRLTLDEILDDLSEKGEIFLLDEGGKDIRNVELKGDISFVLGDHLGLTSPQKNLVRKKCTECVSVSPLSLHADQCIVIVLNELDRLQEERC
jgi:tRNA (pseudouridine54-N1)-methyltransferase